MVSSNGRAPDTGPELDMAHELPGRPGHEHAQLGEELPEHGESPQPSQPDDDDDAIPR